MVRTYTLSAVLTALVILLGSFSTGPAVSASKAQRPEVIDEESNQAYRDLYAWKAPRISKCKYIKERCQIDVRPIDGTTKTSERFVDLFVGSGVGVSQLTAPQISRADLEKSVAEANVSEREIIKAILSSRTRDADDLSSQFCDPVDLDFQLESADIQRELLCASPNQRSRGPGGLLSMMMAPPAYQNFLPERLLDHLLREANLLKDSLSVRDARLIGNIVIHPERDSIDYIHYKVPREKLAFSVSIEPGSGSATMSVTAPLVRLAVLQIISKYHFQLAEIERKRGTLTAASYDSLVAYVAGEAIRDYRNGFSLILAHELAHVYRNTPSERAADCFGLVNVMRAKGNYDLGFMGLVMQSVQENHQIYWYRPPKGEIEERFRLIKMWTSQQKNLVHLEQECGTYAAGRR